MLVLLSSTVMRQHCTFSAAFFFLFFLYGAYVSFAFVRTTYLLTYFMLPDYFSGLSRIVVYFSAFCIHSITMSELTMMA